MADRSDDASSAAPLHAGDVEARLRVQVEKWRERLLDLGNRNPLVNCSFNPSRGVVRIVHPDCDTVWRKLAADNEAGAASMRFPWRRELVPPPANDDASEERDESVALIEDNPNTDLGASDDTKDGAVVANASDTPKEKDKEKEWHPSLDECLGSPRLRESDLLTELTDKAIERRLRTLDGYAHLSMSEQGVHCLYVAFGFLKWFESVDSDKELRSPLMLVPVSLSRVSADAPWELVEAEDDVVDNLCLRQRLRQDFSLELPELPDIDSLEDRGARLTFLDAVRVAIQENSRWEVEDRCALGRFAFPKIAMWKDLGDHTNSIISNALCQTIAGDSSVPPQLAFGAADSLPNASQLDDEVPPGEVKAILDCDSSQLEAIVAARKGVSFVLEGPPGTGKSQTIANIIADALAEGRRVLFVSEKMAALDVVKRRLDECGLGDFCLECHSSKANRKAVLEELRWCLEIPTEVYDDTRPKLDEVKRKRDALNAYVRSVHRPRQPLGLSPYEIYGHVTRLARDGLANLSRCPLPDPASVDRTTFDAWLSVLGRAQEVGDVISRHNLHPWRGCKLTQRSLSLGDDLQHHFKSLSTSLNQFERLSSPLVEDELLTQRLSPATLNDTLRLFRECVAAPHTPRSWFTEPERIAKAVLARHAAQVDIGKVRESLADYVEDVADRYECDCVSKTLDLSACEWHTRLSCPLPETVREQCRVLTKLTDDLRRIEASSMKMESALTKLTEEVVIPVATTLRVAAVPKLIQVARLVAASYPLQPSWFDSSNWGRLRQASDDACVKLHSLKAYSSCFGPRITAERAELLLEGVDDLATVQGAWANVQSVVSTGTIGELEELEAQASRLSVALETAWSATRELTQHLGFTGDHDLTGRSSQALAAAIEAIVETGGFHGAWVNADVRARVRALGEEAIADLLEAEELRESLRDRLSHRAFKASASQLAERSNAYRSWLKRMFGGFSRFKGDIADVYARGVPNTKTLLADCERLRQFHRRMNDAREAAIELEAVVPNGHAADDPAAWRQLLDAVDAFETILTSVPETTSALTPVEVRFDPVVLQTARQRVIDAWSTVESILATSRVADLSPRDEPVGDAIAQIRALADSAIRCRKVWEGTTIAYSTQPDTFDVLLEDLRNAAACRDLRDQVTQLFAQNHDEMPRGAIPTERACWERLRSGIDAAEKLSGIVRDTETVCDVVCVEGRISSPELTSAADDVQLAFKELDAAFKAVNGTITLSPPGQPIVELGRRTPETLRLMSQLAADQFETRSAHLRTLLEWIQPESDVPLVRLKEDAEAISELKLAFERLEEANESLRLLDAELPTDQADSGHTAATWLMTQSERGTIPALLQAAAAAPSQRERVAHILADLKPVVPEFKASWEFLTSVFDVKEVISSGITIWETPLGDLATHLSDLCSEMPSLDEWLRFSRWQREMQELGFAPVVRELLEGNYKPEQAADCVAARYYRSLFDHVAQRDPTLGEFDIEEHERIRERFRQLDEWEVKAAATRIRQYQLGRDDRPRPGWAAPSSSELGILQREIQKKRRHKPLRKLFAEIPGVLQRLKPCIMMSPLSVSTFLETDEIRFDLVIFDEASQVFPWDAMGAIHRGTQLVVAGDEKQLPPTNFFNRADIESEDEEDDIGDFESILSVSKSIGMPSKRLRWHYRSRREPLIVFSNRHFYAGELVTFPSVRDATGDAVRLELVPEGRWVDRKNLAEAERIADLVVEHLRTRPEVSLGIIAFNVSQQHAIEDVIYDRRRIDPEIDALFDVGLAEPMFVKNLENVQGDERDVILLSMGYAFNESGKFLKNFGPLTKAGGERRLNVAVTRARDEAVFVASVRAADMDLSASRSEGAHLLKAYLEYAERGVDSLARNVDSLAGECESPFEQEVAAALMQRGLNPVAQVGCGGFRIDLALRHPARPGEFCLGVECDGATYHSSHTARDRDRIRQAVLEGLGWRIIRIWSTDWVRNPVRQVERVIVAYEEAIATSSHMAVPVRRNIGDENGEWDLQPTIVKEQKPTGRTFDKIEDVPDGQIRAAATVIMSRVGATDWDDLIKMVARELGFGRTGSKIRRRLETVLLSELRSGTLRRVGDRVTTQQLARSR